MMIFYVLRENLANFFLDENSNFTVCVLNLILIYFWVAKKFFQLEKMKTGYIDKKKLNQGLSPSQRHKVCPFLI